MTSQLGFNALVRIAVDSGMDINALGLLVTSPLPYRLVDADFLPAGRKHATLSSLQSWQRRDGISQRRLLPIGHSRQASPVEKIMRWKDTLIRRPEPDPSQKHQPIRLSDAARRAGSSESTRPSPQVQLLIRPLQQVQQLWQQEHILLHLS